MNRPHRFAFLTWLAAAVMLGCLLVATCQGQPLDTSGVPYAAVCEIEVKEPGARYQTIPGVGLVEATFYGGGSGTLIEPNTVLTCWHIFRDGVESVTVRFPDGSSFPATITATDQKWDLATLRVNGANMAPVRIAQEYPKPGDLVRYCGYGPNNQFACRPGRVMGYARPDTSSPRQMLTVTGTARDGDSGGPIFNTQGELVAVLWGGEGVQLYGSFCERIRTFLGNRRNPSGGCLPRSCQAGGCYGTQPQAPFGSYGTFNGNPVPPATRPIPQEPLVPIAPPSGPPPPTIDMAALSARLERVEAGLGEIKQGLAAISLRQGPQGEQGPMGPRGPPGTPGNVSRIDTHRLDTMEARLTDLEARPDFFDLRVIDAVTGQAKEQRVYLGPGGEDRGFDLYLPPGFSVSQ